LSFTPLRGYYSPMIRLSNRYRTIVTAVLLALAGGSVAGAAADGDAPLPAGALLLFGANWCAPCLGELRSLPAWGAAMAPAPVLVAWTDRAPPRLWREWPVNARLLGLDEARALLRRMESRTAGLPYVALVDAGGHICADLRGALSPARLAAMKARCAASAPPKAVSVAAGG
jgi:hypothetical protein